MSENRCEFAVAHTYCGKMPTHRRHVVVKSIVKGAASTFSPPDAFYCTRHAELVSKWNDGSNPRIHATLERLP